MSYPLAHTATGIGNDGSQIPLSATREGHLEVELHAPLLPFGSLHTESMHVVFQADSVYGVNAGQNKTTTSLSGAVTGTDSLFTCATGTTQYAFSTLQSRKRLRYRPGQGCIGRCTLMFGTPVASSIVVGGYGHAEDGLYIGYNGTSFGILYSKRGVREQQTLTMAAKSATGTPSYVVVSINTREDQ